MTALPLQSETLADIIPLHRPSAAHQLVEAYCHRYTNSITAKQRRSVLNQLLDYTGTDNLNDLTETAIIRWCTHGDPANNTVYCRIGYVRTFTKWCIRNGHLATDPATYLREPGSPLRTYHRTYGKVQDKHPGRWLTHEQAYSQLIGACQDGSTLGLRDELIIRLGLLGMRRAEIAALTVRNLEHLPTITWRGKGHKPRQATAGTSLSKLVANYLSRYWRPSPDSPLLCPQKGGSARRRPLAWNQPCSAETVSRAVTKRAADAGLGHLATHDLRRTAAGILHTATDDSGAHFFDLLDIQKVLGHSDPTVTMKCYLAPMDTDVLDRAATLLD